MPAKKPAPEARPCANCGDTAVVRTTNPGASVVSYCGTCADQLYPDGEGLEPINAR